MSFVKFVSDLSSYKTLNHIKMKQNLKEQLKSLRKKVGENDAAFPEIEKVVREHWND